MSILLNPAHAITGGLNALTQAVINEDMAAVRAALDSGANPDEIDASVKHAPLHIAVTPGGLRNSEIVRLLAQYKVNLDSESPVTHLTPLMASMVVTEGGPFGVIERTKASALFNQLLDLGANPNASTQVGITALMLATELNALEFVQKLLAKGARVNAQDRNGQTALHAAYASDSSPALLDALRKAGADENILNKASKKPAEMRVAAAAPTDTANAPAPIAPAAKPASSAAVPAGTAVPATPNAALGKSKWSNWLIGGAVVAAAVVGGVVLAAVVEDQKKKGGGSPVSSSQLGAALTNALSSSGGTVLQPVDRTTVPIAPTLPPLPGDAGTPAIPVVIAPPPAASTSVYDGVYTASKMHPDGYTHTETVTVKGVNVIAQHTFTNGISSGRFDWTGTIAPTSANSGNITGNGVISNQGSRPFILSKASRIGLGSNGIMSILWSGTDPKYGPIGGESYRSPVHGKCVAYEIQAGSYPSVIDVTETWQSGGGAQWKVDNNGPRGWVLAAGLDPQQVFRVCDGKFFAGTYSRTVPTETSSPYFLKQHTLEIANGVMTHTLRHSAQRPPDGNYIGVTLVSYASDFTYVSSYNIATGQYSTSARGGQRAATVDPKGNTWSSYSTVTGGVSGKVPVVARQVPSCANTQ